MKAIILDSKSDTQFHFGRSTLDSDTSLDDSTVIFHSDSLWSAFVQNCASINDTDVEMFINWFEEDKIRLSSLLICMKIEDKYIYFLPKPISLNLFPTIDRKKTKKIKYLSKSVLEQGIKPFEWFTEKCIILNNEFVVLKDELGLDTNLLKNTQLYETHSIPKVKVRGYDTKDNFYHQTNVQLISNSLFSTKYYFLMDTNLDDEWKQFEKYLKLLISNGIGGELSTGCGHIDSYEVSDFTFDLKTFSHYFSCSLSIPNNDEYNACLFYTSKIRGGRKLIDDTSVKCVEMLLEGSVFTDKIKGKIVDLTPIGYNIPIKRSGMPLLLPLHDNYNYDKELA